jgi:GNAT superfamily N-acetyltransferase
LGPDRRSTAGFRKLSGRTLEIRPLETAALEASARLLRERHERHRQAEPLLPAVEDFGAQLERDLAHEQARGLVASRGSDPVAYLIGRVEDDPRLGDRRGYVDFAGCAAADGEAEAVRDLYAALAQDWVDAGVVRHVALVPSSDTQLLDAWHRLAFGIQYMWAIRETAALPAVEGVEVRAGTRADLDFAARLDRTLYEHQAKAPSFSGLELPDHDELRAEWSDVGGGDDVHFVGELDGEPVGHLLLYRRLSGDLHVPEQNIDLAHAATAPEARGRGVGTALTHHALTWAHEQGFRTMTTDWRSANLLSSRHWPARGFRPTFYRLYRHVP